MNRRPNLTYAQRKTAARILADKQRRELAAFKRVWVAALSRHRSVRVAL